MDDELEQLLKSNRELVDKLTQVGESQHDLLQLFTRMHTEISKLILNNIMLFEAPKPLLRLNIGFANAYIKAATGEKLSKETGTALSSAAR